MFKIKKAERKKVKLRLGIAGLPGSGKTWSSLEIATGMIGLDGKIGMIDTESGRGELYANNFNYDVITLNAPYDPDRYIEAIKTFENAGYDVIIIDSLSHAWAGDGGVLSIADNSGFSNNKFTGWRVATPKQNRLVDAIIGSKAHIICTVRVKSEYVVEKNDKGKSVPKKVGFAPVQRDGLEYEFTIFMEINSDNIANFSKDSTQLFSGKFLKPSKEMGEDLIEWLNSGKEVPDEPNPLDSIKESIAKIQSIEALNKAYRQMKSEHPELSNEIIELCKLQKLSIEDVAL